MRVSLVRVIALVQCGYHDCVSPPALPLSISSSILTMILQTVCKLYSCVSRSPCSCQSHPYFSSSQTESPSSKFDDDETPVTSLPCQWKAPKKRKRSTLPMSEAIFQKHEYAQPVKRKIKPLEDFDPRPPEYRGAVTSHLQDLLEKLRGEQLCVSFLFDPKCQHWDNYLSPAQLSSHSSPDATGLKCTIAAFKSSLQVSEDQARRMEQNTRKQRQSSLWYSVRRYRITSSIFGSILSRRDSTPPDSLVLRIIQPRSFSTAATKYGIEKEAVAVKEYVSHQHSYGHPDLTVSP